MSEKAKSVLQTAKTCVSTKGKEPILCSYWEDVEEPHDDATVMASSWEVS